MRKREPRKDRWPKVLRFGLVAIASAIAPPPSSLQADLPVWEVEARPDDYLEALGRKAGVWGDFKNGFEAWVYPFKLFGGLRFFISDDGERWSPLASHAVRQVVAPHETRMDFQGPGWSGALTLLVPRDEGGFLLRCHFDSGRPLRLALEMEPSLAPMHLERAGPLTLVWNGEEQVMREPFHGLELRLGLPGWKPAGTQMPLRFEGQATREGRSAGLRVAGALGWRGGPNPEPVLQRLLKESTQLRAHARDHYERLLARAPAVRTPDPKVNLALDWSVVALDQLRIDNPQLGHGLVSGYSASGDGTRPRYCWFFEEPTLTSWAFHRVGLSSHVREALHFLQRWQRIDGKTVHEVSQSLAYQPDYFRAYPYAYMHSDGPAYFLAAYGHYYRSTGDFEFIAASWDKIRRTLKWCFSRVDPKDGLLTIDRGDWGSAESSTAIWKDTQLSAMWIRALDEAAYLADAMEDAELSEHCRAASERARLSLQEAFWNEDAGRYHWGLTRAGRPVPSQVPHHAVGFWLSRFPSNRVVRSLEQMASSEFRTDWGVRSLALSDPTYDPSHYQSGSVWPVWNAGVLISDFRHGREVDAYRNWRSMVALRGMEGVGCMPEVLSGHACRRLPEGAPHQMFSELAVVNGFYDGMLGLQVDVPARRIHLSPWLPPDWPRLEIDRVPAGQSRFDLVLERVPGRWRCQVHGPTKDPWHILVHPRLPQGASVTSLVINGEPSDPAVLRGRGWIQGEIRPGDPSMNVAIRHDGGVVVMPVDPPLQRHEISHRFRWIRSVLKDDVYHLLGEGLPGREYRLRLWTDRRVVRVSGGRLRRSPEGARELFWRPEPDARTNLAGFARGSIEIHLE